MTIPHTPEFLDIAQAIARWEEILDRTEADETIIITVDGISKARAFLTRLAHGKSGTGTRPA